MFAVGSVWDITDALFAWGRTLGVFLMRLTAMVFSVRCYG